MSDAIVIERPPAGLNAAGYWFGAYGLILERGAPWQQGFEPAFWVHAAAKLRAGDQIEVHTADHEIAFVLYVKKVNHRVLPVLVEFPARRFSLPICNSRRAPLRTGRRTASSACLAGWRGRFAMRAGSWLATI